jgi:hypothetical protein
MTQLQLCDLPGERAVLTREQWGLAARIDGVVSAGELSRICGLALHDTVERAGELVEAGLCTAIAESPPTQLPRRTRGTSVARPDAPPASLPSADTLQRIADGLRKLN